MVRHPPRPGATAGFVTLFLAVFAVYAAAAWMSLRPGAPEASRPGRRAAVILLFAALFRLTLLPATPALSDDIYRYLWDGRVVAAGRNPYRDPPASARLADLRDSLHAKVAHQEVRTIYPPAAQGVFALAAASGTGVAGMKAFLVLADLLVIAILGRLLALRRLPSGRMLLYAWSPLAVVEVAWSGHLEPVGVACMLLAAAAIIQKRDLRSTVALTLGGLVKLLPLALFAPFGRSIRARFLLLPPLMFAAACWPFRAAGWSLASGLREYAGRWIANESLFGVAVALLARAHPEPALRAAIGFVRARLPLSGPLDLLYGHLHPADLARGLCAAAAAAVAAVLVARRVEPLRGAFLLLGAMLVLSPTVHPWYLLWILPWLCLFPSPPWILLSGLVALAYVNLGASGRESEPYPWVRWLEYGPFYALLLGRGVQSAWLRRRAPRPVPPRGDPV